MDDYLYSHSDYLKGQEFDDLREYEQYQTQGETLSHNDWRRENIDQFIQKLSQWMRAAYPNRPIGVSPFGIWRDSKVYNIKGTQSYDTLFADSLNWINQGWIDLSLLNYTGRLIVQTRTSSRSWHDGATTYPQIAFSSPAFCPGLSVSLQAHPEEEFIRAQALIQKDAQGIIFFRSATILADEKAKEMLREVFHNTALPVSMSLRPRPPRPIVFQKGDTLYPLNQKPQMKLWLS